MTARSARAKLESSDMVNVVAAAGLDATTAIAISRLDLSSGEYKKISDVTDPGEIAKFLSILDMPVPVIPATECQPIFEMTFQMPEPLRDLPIHLRRHQHAVAGWAVVLGWT